MKFSGGNADCQPRRGHGGWRGYALYASYDHKVGIGYRRGYKLDVVLA